MDFKISYEDAKKLLAVFYNSPYASAAPYVHILHNITEIDGNLSLRQKIDVEIALADAQSPKPE